MNGVSNVMVNGEEMKLRAFETPQTLHTHLAVSNRVLPAYFLLVNENGSLVTELTVSSHIKSRNLLDEMEKMASTEDFVTVYKDAHTLFRIPKETIPILMYLFSIRRKDLYIQELFFTWADSTSHLSTDIIKNRAEILGGEYKRKLDQFIKQEAEQEKLIQKLFSLKPVSATLPEMTRTKVELTFTVKYDIYEFFNQLIMTQEIPFATINSFYKVLKSFIPSKYWIFTDPEENKDKLHLKLLNLPQGACPSCVQKGESRTDLYSDITILFEPVSISIEEQINKVHLYLESELHPRVSQQDLLQRVIRIFPAYKDITDISLPRQVHMKSEFYVPNFVLDRPIFLDLMMNDPLVSSFLLADEHYKIQKQRGGILTRFMLSPNLPESSHMSCMISEYIVESSSTQILRLGKEFTVGSPFLKIRINRSDSMTDAQAFQSFLTHLLSYYQDTKPSVVKEYTSMFPDFKSTLQQKRESRAKKTQTVHRTSQTLKDINPDLFVDGYARLCNKEPPIILDQDPSVEDSSPHHMLFPKQPEEGKQYWYTCKKPGSQSEYVYPYLKKSILSNRDKYPVVPCCCLRDQNDKENAYWKMYYEQGKTLDDIKEIMLQEKSTGDRYVLTSNKVLPYNRTGYLPPQLQHYFYLLDPNHTYLREGGFRTVNSAIEMVWNGTDPHARTLNQQEKIRELRLIREKLISAYGSRTTQEGFQDPISSYQTNPDKYFDPRMFIKAMEDYFHIHLFLFTRDKDHPEGELVAPYFTEGYLRLKASQKEEQRPYMLLYIHYGAEFDILDYPQCEVIFSIGKSPVYQFPSTHLIIPKLHSTFVTLFCSSIPLLPSPHPTPPLSIPFHNNIQFQGVDQHGKTRFLSFSSPSLTIYTQPLPNLPNVPLGMAYHPISLSEAKSFLASESIADYEYDIVQTQMVGIRAKLASLLFYIPLHPIPAPSAFKPLPPLPSSVSVSSVSVSSVSVPSSSILQSINFIHEESQLQAYYEIQRRARYMVEYTFYLFSLFYKTHPTPKIDAEYMNRFADTCISIDPEFQYGKVIRAFTKDAGVLRNNQLVVHRDEIKKRLMYSLLLEWKHNEYLLLHYSSFRYLQAYYADVRDFQLQLHESSLLVQGKETLLRWIYQHPPSYVLYDTVKSSGPTLDSLLQEYDPSKPFMVIFTSSRCNYCRNFMERIHSRKQYRKYPTLMERYGSDLHVVYITIEENQGLALEYQIASVPYAMFMKMDPQSHRLQELPSQSRLQLGKNVFENLKRVNDRLTLLFSD